MKNDREMFQSVLSRRDEYRRKKEKRIVIVKRTVPAAACFCLAAALGIGFHGRFAKPPHIGVETVETVVTSTLPETFTTSSYSVNTTVVTAKGTTAAVKTTTQSSAVNVTSKAVVTSGSATADRSGEESPGTKGTTASQRHDSSSAAAVLSETTAAAVTDEEINTTSEIPVPVNAQPIHFDNVQEMTDSVSSGDVSAYTYQYQQAYLSAFDRLKNDGFIYKPNNTSAFPPQTGFTDMDEDGNGGGFTSNTNVSEAYSISLRDDLGNCVFPYAVYEDIGVGYYVTFMEKTYHVTFYCADVDVLAESSDIADYMQKRTGRQSDRTISFGSNAVSLHCSDNGQNYASAFIDDEHYFDVVTSASERELISFLELLSYEKIGI